MLKREELANPDSYLNRAADDEPVFILRGKDPIAVNAVRHWANEAEFQGRHKPEKIAEARVQADRMEKYAKREREAPASPGWTRDDARTCHLTGLLGYTLAAAEVAAWSNEDVRAIDEWAPATQARAAGDETVQIPPMPKLLKRRKAESRPA